MDNLGIVGEIVNLGLTGILLYLLLTVWNRLTVVTDRLIDLTDKVEKFERYVMGQTQIMKKDIQDNTDDRK